MTSRSATSAQHSRSQWAALRFFSTLWQQARESAAALPAAAWRRWLQITLLGFVLVALGSAGMTLLASYAAQRGLQAWDERILRQLLEQAPFSFNAAIVLESPGNIIGMCLLVGAAVLVALRARRPLIAASVLSLYWVGTALLWIAWAPWDRQRPDLVAGGLAAPGLHSFPSGHIMHVVAVYGFLIYLWCRASASWIERIIAIALGAAGVLVVGLARLVLGVHWPSDLIGGILCGLAWMLVGIVALKRAEEA